MSCTITWLVAHRLAHATCVLLHYHTRRLNSAPWRSTDRSWRGVPAAYKPPSGVDSGRAVRDRGRRGGVDGGLDVEVSGDSERALRGKGRRGGRGLILNDVVVVLNRVAVPNQPIRPNALAIQTGNRI